MMLTLPNSGSTWLADLIASTCRLPYQDEFFNPLHNARYEDELARHFGCELISCYEHIAQEGGRETVACIDKTWGQEELAFTREIFSPLKLQAFTKRFNVFCLLRSQQESFPPHDLRVWSYYEHAWWSMWDATPLTTDAQPVWHRPNGAGRYPLNGQCSRSRAIEAHWILSQEIRYDAYRLGVPVLDWEDIMQSNFEDTCRLLAPTSIPNPEAVAQAIILSRQRSERPLQMVGGD